MKSGMALVKTWHHRICCQTTDPFTQENDGWSKNVRFQMNILPTMGVEANIYAQFTGSSNGAQRATGEMIKQWVKEVRTGAHREEVPVVKFLLTTINISSMARCQFHQWKFQDG